jgi:hypothetical protein
VGALYGMASKMTGTLICFVFVHFVKKSKLTQAITPVNQELFLVLMVLFAIHYRNTTMFHSYINYEYNMTCLQVHRKPPFLFYFWAWSICLFEMLMMYWFFAGTIHNCVRSPTGSFHCAWHNHWQRSLF